MRTPLDILRALYPQAADVPDVSEEEEGLDDRPASRAVRWNFILVWFMRMLALMWIAKGLGYWAVILGADSAPTPFEARTTGFQATTIYFAIIDLVAAGGPLLSRPWGGVLRSRAVLTHPSLWEVLSPLRAGGDAVSGVLGRRG